MWRTAPPSTPGQNAVAAAHGRVNLIFNNAGVALSSTVDGMQYDDLDWIIGINFWGVVHGTKAFLPHLKASGEGHIVNTSSVFGLFAQPGMGAYNASKYAVRGFTESLRQELDLMDCGVSATTVHPGGIKTNIARASRVSPSVNGLLVRDAQQGREEFEKFFITTPEKAAGIILDGVRANKRRVLVGPDAYAAERHGAPAAGGVPVAGSARDAPQAQGADAGWRAGGRQRRRARMTRAALPREAALQAPPGAFTRWFGQGGWASSACPAPRWRAATRCRPRAGCR